MVQLKETFDLFDVNGDGGLQPVELRALLLANGTEMSMQDVERMVAEVDLDESGAISFVEFASYMMARESISHHKAAEQIFDMIDTDGSGVLSTSELRKAFYNLRTGLDDDELMEIICSSTSATPAASRSPSSCTSSARSSPRWAAEPRRRPPPTSARYTARGRGRLLRAPTRARALRCRSYCYVCAAADVSVPDAGPLFPCSSVL